MEALKELGLSSAEIKIFKTLISFGTLTPTQISEKSGLYRPYVYDNLTKLIERGLVTYVCKKKKRYYKAVDPNVLIKLFDSKKELLVDTVKELQLSYLEKKSDYDVQIFEGREGLKTFYEQLYKSLKNKETKVFFAFGGTGEATKFLKFYFPQLLKRGFIEKIHKHVSIKMIYNSTARNSVMVKEYSRLLNIKISKKSKDVETSFIITDNQIATMVLKEKPFIVCVSNKHIINSYKTLFKILWKSVLGE